MAFQSSDTDSTAFAQFPPLQSPLVWYALCYVCLGSMRKEGEEERTV